MASNLIEAKAVAAPGVRLTRSRRRTPGATVILLVAPFLIACVAFLIYPTVRVILLSFTNADIAGIASFTGTATYVRLMTIPVGITQVQSWYGIACPRQTASAVLAALPTAVLFVIFQRRVAQGVAITSGIK